MECDGVAVSRHAREHSLHEQVGLSHAQSFGEFRLCQLHVQHFVRDRAVVCSCVVAEVRFVEYLKPFDRRVHRLCYDTNLSVRLSEEVV